MGNQAMATVIPESYSSDTKLPRRRILACLDCSASSEVCVPYAVSVAKTFGSAVTLVHVMQPHDEHNGAQACDALGWELSRREAQGYLEQFEEEVSQALGHPVDIRLEQGHPAERIVDLAHEIDADLIVLGSHGEAGVKPWKLGATVQQVLGLVDRSVFIVHGPSNAPLSVNPKHILVPLDGSVRTESVLPAAMRIAHAYDAEMLLTHVVQEPLPGALLSAAEDMQLAQQLAARLESNATKYLQHLQQQLIRDGTSVNTLVGRHANERQGLLDISQENQADLIVLSAHGSGCDSERSFGSVATFLLTHSLVPLLVLQDLSECSLHRAEDVAAKLASPPLRARYGSEHV